MEDDQFAVSTFFLFANLLLTHNVRLTNGGEAMGALRPPEQEAGFERAALMIASVPL